MAVTNVPDRRNGCLLEVNVIHQEDDNGQVMRMKIGDGFTWVEES